MAEVTLAHLAESKSAIAVPSAIWAWTRSACIVPDERPGLVASDGVIKIRGWAIHGIKSACILFVLAMALRWAGTGYRCNGASRGWHLFQHY